ncbi:MAG: ATP-binding protein [Deltaproteobacteria bacterium]|nr:ATP-binding protein [Deltaproteobacteria bacterium]
MNLNTRSLIKLIRVISLIAPVVVILVVPSVFFLINVQDQLKGARHMTEELAQLAREVEHPDKLQPFLEEAHLRLHNTHGIPFQSHRITIYSAEGLRLAQIHGEVSLLSTTIKVPLSFAGENAGTVELIQSHSRAMETTRPVALMGLLVGVMIFMVAQLIIIPAMKGTLKQLEEKQKRLQDAISMAGEANQAKSRFLSNMSHEIRTPLNAILGLSELMSRTELSEEQQEFVNNIRLSGDLLLGVVNNILDFSKIESGHLEADKHQFQLDGLFSRVNGIIQVQAQKKGLAFSLEVAPGVPQVLVGDELRLQQVLVNLLANGVKFTRQGSVSLRVSARPLDNNRHELTLLVQDTGIGLSPEQIENLFQPFYQVDNTARRAHEGTGLGLSITKGIIDLLGGSISLDSQPGQGSTFTVRLVMEQGPDETSIRGESFQDMDDDDHWKNLWGRRILLVEDNEINRMLALKVLQNCQMEVVTAENGRQALEKLSGQHEEFDAVLLDLHMPVMDGYETAASIRKNPAHDNLPVIALTANVLPEDRKRCLELGFNAYLTKPLQARELFRTLNEYLGPSDQAAAATLEQWKAAPPKAENLNLPDLPGIDLQDARRRMLGEDALLVSMIRSFGERFSGVADELHGALEKNDLERAGFLAHSLSGAAGNISARELQAASRELEKALNTSREEQFEVIMSLLEDNLETVLGAVDILEDIQPEP